jgi:hypothetical protein
MGILDTLKKTTKGAASFIGNEMLGIDDIRRAGKYASQGQWGKALKSAGAGALELGSTAFGGGAALKAVKAARPLAAALNIGIPAATVALSRMTGSVPTAKAAPISRTQISQRPVGFTTADRFAEAVARRTTPSSITVRPSNFTTADRFVESLNRGATPSSITVKPSNFTTADRAEAAIIRGGGGTNGRTATAVNYPGVRQPSPGAGAGTGTGTGTGVDGGATPGTGAFTGTGPSGLMGPDAAAELAYQNALNNAQRVYGATRNQMTAAGLQGELADAAAERAARRAYMGNLIDLESAAAEGVGGLNYSPATLGVTQEGLANYLAQNLSGITTQAGQRRGDIAAQTRAAEDAYQRAIKDAELQRLINQVERTRQRSLDWLNMGGTI